MTCTTRLACHDTPPRRAATRAPHLCRGRGGRGCRCHMTARRRLSRPVLAGDGHPLRWRPAALDLQPLFPPPAALPRRPQAPPLPV
ncbi:hypothetical protein [Paracoccus sp. (in: a-proteobacteria)]|uniref:hypothetical protein n=1 Tax=Paracoccus sp. TaxID=267 RepID=UPI00321F9F8D